MNSRAFTLVELMVTVVIIGLVSYLGFPSLMKLLHDNKKSEFEYYGNTMVSAAKLYMQKEGNDIKENSLANSQLLNGTYEISVSTLVSEGYISNFSSSKKGVRCDAGAAVSVRNIVGTTTYIYDYKLTCHDTSSKKKYTKNYGNNDFVIENE